MGNELLTDHEKVVIPYPCLEGRSSEAGLGFKRSRGASTREAADRPPLTVLELCGAVSQVRSSSRADALTKPRL